ncbi:FkbM family methyltransferase [Mycobacterium sp. G7A2]|uniref:FkbM family methyltransferase n=1 Tax=Mycobacterium sp. G7A2 TaxID=3317307 RepID=UPI0035A93CEC
MKSPEEAVRSPHRRIRGLDSLRERVRGNRFVARFPWLRAALRAAWHSVDFLRVRKSRSYIHGLLFDLKGGTYSTEGMSFRIASDQFPRSFRSRLYFDIYEAPERELAHRWIEPGASVLELGGCIGVVSCVVNKLLEHPRNHVVVEANPTLIGVLSQNRDANGCSFRIENCIVSRAAEAEFYISGIMTASRKDSGVGKRIAVSAKPLEELEDQYGIKFDTLILDIEGGEFDFFTENCTRLEEVKLVILELHRRILSPHELEVCTSILERAGLVRVDAQDETEVWARPRDSCAL